MSDVKEELVEEEVAEEEVSEDQDYSSLTDEQLANLHSVKQEEEKTEEEAESAESEATAEEEQAPAEDKKTPDTKAEEKPVEDSETEILKKRLEDQKEMLRRQVEEQELLIRKNSNQIGELRKQSKEVSITEDEILEAQSDPKKMIELIDKRSEQKIRALLESEKEQKARVESEVYQVKEAIHRKYQDFDQLLPVMAELAVADGLDPKMAEQFKRNPYAEDIRDLVRYAERAKYHKEVIELKKKVDELSLGGKKQMDRIKKASKLANVGIPSKSGQGASKVHPESNINPAMLSDEELDRRLSKKGLL